MPAGQAAVSRAERRSGSATETTTDYNGTPHKNLREEPHKAHASSRIRNSRAPSAGKHCGSQRVTTGLWKYRKISPIPPAAARKIKNRSFTKRSCFIFLTGSFPADSRKSGCCMIRKSPEHLQRKIDSIDDNSGAECNPCPHGSF